MQHIAQQLRSVRRTGRLLLVLRRLAQVLAVLLPLAILLGLLDYALRMPGAMRLLIGLTVLSLAGVWLFTRLNRALRFWPSLAELALRAERLYPQLAGSLASAVEFSLQPQGYAEPNSTAMMAKTAVDEMQEKTQGVDVKRMVKLKPTVQACLLALLAALVLVAVVAATPQASATAAQRWLLPMGDTQWPKVNEVETLTPDNAVFAADGKVRLRAQVTRGWSEGMRMTVQYRVLDEAGEGDWQSVRVAEQKIASQPGRHVYEAMLDVPPAVARSLMAGRRSSATLEARYSAGDDTTPTQSLTLAARPEIESVVVQTEPPNYALGLIGKHRLALHEQADRIASTSAYQGSKIRLDITFNKPLTSEQAMRALEPLRFAIDVSKAWGAVPSTGDLVEQVYLEWVLDETVEGTIQLVDSFGLSSTDNDKQYRIQAVEDELPAAVLLKPATDESVLPGASVALSAMAQDDIAVQSLKIDIVVPDRENTPEDAERVVKRSLDDGALITTGRSETLELDYTLVLKDLNLLPGDEVLITAVGRDIYDLNGYRHDPVASDTRRLRVITEQELADQVRRVLRGVRNTGQSLERNQRLVSERTETSPPAETAEQQGDISRRIAAQQDTVEALRDRLARNRPHNLEALEDLLDRADAMLEQAETASELAEQSLGEAANQQQQGDEARQREQEAVAEGDKGAEAQARQDAQEAKQNQEKAQGEAREAQDKAREQLAELVAALDTGESVGEIESELAAIQSDAERAARKTKALLPKTIGQKAEDLDEVTRKELEENADKQRELADRADALIDKMRAAAEQIGENGETPEERATAKTLSEAADIAERQGLEENTEQAAEKLDQNQVADAANQQQQAMNTLEQMMQELGKQKQRRQEELKRLLQELAQKVQKLVDEQRDQLARAEAAEPNALGLLEQPQFMLRKRTMAVQAQAMQAPKTEPVGEPLGLAVKAQAEAVKAIRVPDKQSTLNHEAAALAQLEAALALINKEQEQQQEEQQREERFALRQAYYDLADRQERLLAIGTQHQQDEDYSRRDWRQINRLYEEELEDKSLDEEQAKIRAKADELKEKAGEAMVYQSLHRRIDQAANRAENRLSGRRVDGLVLDDQRSVVQMLRAMGDALDDTAEQDKFEKEEQEEQEQPEGEGQPGEGEEPPLVPDLAQIKLLREVMIVLRNQTESIAEAGDNLPDADRQQRLNDLAEQQRELKTLGEQLIEKLQQQMQPREQEPRN
ncbi:MAG: hypothetical protein KTR15_14135 [Phycisphaeraceae bacterium]|nr:hypothetical protein [Phycisphaeraceae bacterium]